MKKIFVTFTSVLVIGYFLYTEKPTSTTSDAWEETLDSIATIQVGEMFLLLEMYPDQEYVSLDYTETYEIGFRLHPFTDWGRYIDIRETNYIYSCINCNMGMCFVDETRVRWYENPPHIRIEEDFFHDQDLKGSCEQGRYYKHNFKQFCIDLIEKTQKANEMLCKECSVSNE